MSDRTYNSGEMAIIKATFVHISPGTSIGTWTFTCYRITPAAWGEDIQHKTFDITCYNPLGYVAGIDPKLLAKCFTNALMSDTFS